MTANALNRMMRKFFYLFISIRLMVGSAAGQSQPVYTISTVAGAGASGYSGDGGPATNAQLNSPRGVASDASGNVYIADTGNNVIRRIAKDGIISTFAGTGRAGYSGDGGPATTATLNQPYRVEADLLGNVFIADTGNSRVRKVNTQGVITTVAGNGGTGSYSGDGGLATQATLGPVGDCYPDGNGNLYVAANFMVLKVNSSGIITNIAGNGFFGYSGDGGPATSAALSIDGFVIADSLGNVYISDQTNNRIRKVSNGTIMTVAGNGSAAFAGDGGPATSASLNAPSGIYADSKGNLFIADDGNYRVRVVMQNGTIATIAGNGSPGFGGDGGPATLAMIDPHGLAPSLTGGLYFADTTNQRVRLITPPSQPALNPPSIVSAVSASSFGGFAAATSGTWMEIYGSNLASDSRGWGAADFSSGSAPTILDGTSATVGGQSAFISYISPNQINLQVPSNVSLGLEPLVITTAAGASAPYMVMVNATEPGLLAPSSFNIGGNQYAAAFFSDGATYVMPPGVIMGLASNRASPGDVITFYGIGFGPVTPAIAAGQLTQQMNMLANQLQISFAGVNATIQYAGLAPGNVGVYQFNVVVPAMGASDLVPVRFNLGGTSGTQTLYTAVQN